MAQIESRAVKPSESALVSYVFQGCCLVVEFPAPERRQHVPQDLAHFGASAGQADARRRDAGDVVISSRSGNAADTRLSPPRPAGLRLPRPANYCGLPVMIQLGMGAAAKCQIILARTLNPAIAAELALVLGVWSAL